MAEKPDRLSRLIWSILDQIPDTFVVGSKINIDASDANLIKCYVERLEVQLGLSKEPATQDIIKSILDE